MNGVEVFKALPKDEVDLLLRDIPIDHVVKGVQVLSRPLFIRYFKGYRIQVAGKKRVGELLEAEVRGKGNEELTQLLYTLWNRANGRLYHAVYNLVRTVNEEVEKIESIDDEKARAFLDELLKEFDPARLFLCILLNEVKFSKAVVEEKLGRKIALEVWPPKPEAEAAVPPPMPGEETPPEVPPEETPPEVPPEKTPPQVPPEETPPEVPPEETPPQVPPEIPPQETPSQG
jgi:hypothetical protein